jgi:hypothetical protein
VDCAFELRADGGDETPSITGENPNRTRTTERFVFHLDFTSTETNTAGYLIAIARRSVSNGLIDDDPLEARRPGRKRSDVSSGRGSPGVPRPVARS